jgi:hypothetical protein
MLVWSEAWSAEGEKGETDYYFKHTPPVTCVPAESRFNRSPKNDCLGIHGIVNNGHYGSLIALVFIMPLGAP